MEDMEGGGDHLPRTLRERCRKFYRRASLASGAHWGTCGVVDRVFLEGSRREASLSVGALLGKLLSGELEGCGRRAQGTDITSWVSINWELLRDCRKGSLETGHLSLWELC